MNGTLSGWIRSSPAPAAFVAEYHPTAVAALLAGSAGTPLATSASDLDILVIGESLGPVLRRTLRYADRPVEVFLHTTESLAEFIEREVATRRSPLLHMCAEGRVLLDRDGVGRAVQARARWRLAAGPRPLTPAEHEDRRYAITDLLDDWSSATDRLSRTPIPSR